MLSIKSHRNLSCARITPARRCVPQSEQSPENNKNVVRNKIKLGAQHQKILRAKQELFPVIISDEIDFYILYVVRGELVICMRSILSGIRRQFTLSN